jgi:long-chain acyl-CoA synthetase
LREYHKDPALTRAAFTEDGFFRTGDRGEHDEGGRLRITGRTKELFKTSKGKYVAPAPIEGRLLDDPSVEAACVTGVGFPQPCAVVMLSPRAREQAQGPGRAELEAQLREHLDRVNAGLEHHEALEFLVVASEPWTVDNGLMTPTLKFRRTGLEERYGPRLERWYAAQAPVLWE